MTSERATTEPTFDASPSPNEDWRAWLQVLGAFCINLNTWGMMNSNGAFQTFYQVHLSKDGYSSFEIAWIGSTQAFLMFVVSLAAGALFDAGFVRALL